MIHVFADDTTHSLPALGRIHQTLCAEQPALQLEGMLLHTCQRIEWYAVGSPASPVPVLDGRPCHQGSRAALARLAQIAAGTRSLVLGERFIHQQVRAAAGRLPADHPLFRLATEALRLAEQARKTFDLHASVDYSDLPKLLLSRYGSAPGRLLLVIGGGMLARAVAAAPPAGYERVVMMTRGPRKLRRLVDGLGNVTVIRAPSLAAALTGRPYDTVIATTNLHPDYRAQVAAAACSSRCGGVVDLCGTPALDQRPEGYHHLYDPEVLRTLAVANRDLAERAALARQWIIQQAEVLA
ncbi:hypothetical protein RKE29_24865 [Streptomyces sp. B1866]|uniref:hypothetical protein n=1 Tax=Streptomyces sp. B1866 TaxID=3075431 RepID=UPI00288C9F8E|nr:hypothetical protein [Streptomyces sp. B1866]MDT3399831.1 hypothetical protein [Streptomyces sp. B1866]